MDLHSEFFEGFGTFLYTGRPGGKWNHKTHQGRFASCRIQGKFAAYDRAGNLIGIASSAKTAKILVKTSIQSSDGNANS